MFKVKKIFGRPFVFDKQKLDAVSADKFSGLKRFGPYEGINSARSPRIAFLFPDEYRDHANRLFQVLRNGVRTFPGIEPMFQVPLSTRDVFPVAKFSIANCRGEVDRAACFETAIEKWNTDQDPADMLVVIHGKTSLWEAETPYFRAKSMSLARGIVSQHVTVDLLDNSSQLQWSAAEIALQMFVKLGGIPWIVQSNQSRPSIVIGVGMSHILGPDRRPSERVAAFATCLSSTGPLAFSTVSRVAESRREYLAGLQETVELGIRRAIDQGKLPGCVVIHMSKLFRRDEVDAVEAAVVSSGVRESVPCYVVTLSRESDFICIDTDNSVAAPPRGLLVELDSQQRLLYTEGAEDRDALGYRVPTAIRVRSTNVDDTHIMDGILDDVLQLSRVNYRGFHSHAVPATLSYASLIANFLSHLSPDDASFVRQQAETPDFGDRMWFL